MKKQIVGLLGVVALALVSNAWAGQPSMPGCRVYPTWHVLSGKVVKQEVNGKETYWIRPGGRFEIGKACLVCATNTGSPMTEPCGDQ
jgi:hypothetical protein